MKVSNVIELFADKLKTDLQELLQRKLAAKSDKGYDGNSALGASIRISFLEHAGLIYGFELYLSDYYYWVNKGRQPGKGISREGQEKLAMWIKSRGLAPTISDRRKKQIKSIQNKKVKKAYKQISLEKKIKQVVFVISKKIKEKGYEANHFFDEVVNDGRIERFTTYLREQYKQDLELALIEPLKNAS